MASSIALADLTGIGNIDSKEVNINGFTLKVNVSDDIEWQQNNNEFTPIFKDDSKYNIVIDSKTGTEISRVLKPINEISFIANKLEETNCYGSFYLTECYTTRWDFSKFETKNDVIRTIEPILKIGDISFWEQFKKLFGWQPEISITGYKITYTGIITDLDPALDLDYTTSSNLIGDLDEFSNNVTAGNLGVRLTTPILKFGFNESANGFVDSESAYGSYATTNAVYNASCGTTSTGVDLGGCYEFNGVNQYMGTAVNSVTLSKAHDSHSLCFWMKQGTNNDTGRMLNTHNGGAYAFGLTGSGPAASPTLLNKIRFEWKGTGCITDYYAPTIGEWYYVCGIYNSEADLISLYVNATLIDTSPCVIVPSTNYFNGAWEIGRIPGYNWWNGSIDEVLIVDRVLSEIEISDLYNGVDLYGKYLNEGHFRSMVFYNSTSTYWNVSLSLADSNGSAKTYDLCQADANCIAYWDLDTGNSDANPYNDEKGSNDGTPTGTNNATGISSGAMRFDGVDDRITFTDTPIGNDSTISLWFYNSNSLVNYMLWGTSDGKFFRAGSTTVLEGRLCNDTIYSYTVPTMSLNTWYNVMLVRNLTGYNDVYLNGVKSSTSAIYCGGVINVDQLASYSSGGRYWPGLLDEFLIYNKSLSVSERDQLYKAGLSQHANTNITLQTRTADSYNISDEGLAAFWSFNSDNSTHVSDETGNYDGTREGVIADATEGNGTVGKGYYFDGINDYISVGNISLYTNHSISTWFKAQSVSSTSRLFLSQSLKNPQVTYIAGFNNLYLMYNNGDGYKSVTWPADNEWHHLSIVRVDKKLKFYLDGIQRGTELTLATNKEVNLSWIGAAPDGYQMLGALDEVRIYNRSLSAEEIQNLYELGSYHIEWNDWHDDGTMQDGVQYQPNANATFIQFRWNYETNDTDVSPYILNHSIHPNDKQQLPTVDIIPPTFNEIPHNRSLDTTEPILIQINATDDIALDRFWINDTRFNISFTGLFENTTIEEGIFYINVSINDTFNNQASFIWNINYTSTPSPIITLIYPAENFAEVDNYTTFVYSIVNYSRLMNSTLYIDGLNNGSSINESISSGINYFYRYLNEAEYRYSINVTDSYGRTGNSTAQYFTVDTVPWEINGLIKTTDTGLLKVLRCEE